MASNRQRKKRYLNYLPHHLWSNKLNTDTATKKSGYICIVGRPNVGKSTLLNHILGQKISITSRKPQTTRHNILGIKTREDAQLIFLDTPGQHLKEPRAINRYMNRVASSAMKDVDVVIFVVDRLKWCDEDEMVLQRVKRSGQPCILVVNKIDKIAEKSVLLPHIEHLATQLPDAPIIPLSALKGDGLEQLETLIVERLPVCNTYFFPEDQITDRSMRFMAAEVIREKIMRQLGEEVPYSATVEIERFEFDERLATISALVLVEKEGQKRILIGDKGARLKQIGIDARQDIELMIDVKVMLELWVKVKSGWSDDDRALQSLGYFDK